MKCDKLAAVVSLYNVHIIKKHHFSEGPPSPPSTLDPDENSDKLFCIFQ
jgi:hypothetical protein